MQRLFNITLFLLSLSILSSCGKLISKEYKLKNQSTSQREYLKLILAQEGIYSVQLDSLTNVLQFKYLPDKISLEELEAFLDENELIKVEPIPVFKAENEISDVEQLELDTILQNLSDELPTDDSLSENTVLLESVDSTTTVE